VWMHVESSYHWRIFHASRIDTKVHF